MDRNIAWHRSLQCQADHVYWTQTSGAYCRPSYTDLRREAAFRCWLRQLDPEKEPPQALPSEELVLDGLALDFDYAYGVDSWWTYPSWSTCELCQERKGPFCASCLRLSNFTNSDGTKS